MPQLFRVVFRRSCAGLLILAMVLTSLLFTPATPSVQAEPSSRIGTMSDAQFFAIPADLANRKPGEIIRQRKVVVRALNTLPMNVDAWQLLYRTTGEDGQPIASATTLLAQRGVRPTKIFSHQTATDSVAADCRPSKTLLSAPAVDFTARGGSLMLSLPSLETLISSVALSKGWGVVIPDVGGLEAQFLLPKLHAYTTLDSIRAAEQFAPWRMSAATPVGLYGYSGGGMETSLAAEYQPGYAPELNIRGAALGSPFRDVAGAVKAVQGAPTSGLVPMGVAALVKQDPAHAKELMRDVSAWGRAKVRAALNQCTPQAVLEGLWIDYNRFFTAPLDVVVNRPLFKKAFARLAKLEHRPTAPLYIYSAVADEIVTVSSVDKLVRHYCRGDASVTYRRQELPPNPVTQLNSPHGITMVTGLFGAVDWLSERMNSSRELPGKCDVQTEPTSLIDSGSLREVPPSIRAMVEGLLGLPIS